MCRKHCLSLYEARQRISKSVKYFWYRTVQFRTVSRGRLTLPYRSETFPWMRNVHESWFMTWMLELHWTCQFQVRFHYWYHWTYFGIVDVGHGNLSYLDDFFDPFTGKNIACRMRLIYETYTLVKSISQNLRVRFNLS